VRVGTEGLSTDFIVVEEEEEDFLFLILSMRLETRETDWRDWRLMASS
jgi:hypothetical protein